MQIVLLDNYDSFTHNLLHLLQIVQPLAEIEVYRNNNTTVLQKEFDILIAGPGPGTPAETGLLTELYKHILETKKPYLGICLGMQFLAWRHNAPIIRSHNQIHGGTCSLNHIGLNLFNGIPQKLDVARYNSLAVQPNALKNTPFNVLATDVKTNEVMALKHKNLPICGIQFHPESFLTQFGKEIIQNFFLYYSAIQ